MTQQRVCTISTVNSVLNRVKRYLVWLTGFLAGVLLCLTCLIILAQIAGRAFHVLIPSADELAGYAMAGSTFFGLSYTHVLGGHIKVSLLDGFLGPRQQRRLNFITLSFSWLVLIWAAWQFSSYAYMSWQFGDLSVGLLGIPLWMPQAVVSAGLWMFCMTITISLIEKVIKNSERLDTHDRGISYLE